MKRLILTFFCIFFLLGETWSQANEMVWGPAFKTKGSYSIIGDYNDFVYAFRYYKRDVFLEKIESEGMEVQFSLKLDLKSPDSKRNMAVEYTYLYEGNIVILASYYDKSDDRNFLKGIIINGEGDIVKDWLDLTSFEAKSKKNTGSFDVAISPDRQSLLIIANTPFAKKENEKYQLFLYTAGLEKKWEKEFILPYSDKQTNIYDFAVDNNGVTHMLAAVFPETKKEKKAARKGKEDYRRQLLVTFSGQDEKITEYEIQLKNKTILGTALRLDSSNNVILTGFYQDNLKKRSGLSGVFYTKIKAGDAEPEVINTHEFDNKFVEELIGEKKAKKGQEISATYVLRQIIPTQDGGAVLLAEQYYVVEHCSTNPKTGQRTCTYTYHYNSIIAVGVNNQGEIVWNSLIKKTSADAAYGYYLSFATFVQKDKIHIVFLDNKKNYNEFGERVETKIKSVNVRKGVAAVATISMNGAVDYSVLYDIKTDKVIMRPKVATQINDNTLIVLGIAKKKVRLGRINF
ncbi:MAG: hypothetical protein ACYC1Q_12530 [Bacteroidia bacterium]